MDLVWCGSPQQIVMAVWHTFLKFYLFKWFLPAFSAPRESEGSQRHTVKKKVREFPVPSRDVTTKLSLGGNNDVITELFLPWWSLVSDIPAGDGKLVNLFLRCRRCCPKKVFPFLKRELLSHTEGICYNWSVHVQNVNTLKWLLVLHDKCV
jgi:hypothetical protein